MPYTFDFSDFGLYAGMLARGVEVTLGLTAVSTVLGGLLGIAGASLAVAGPRWVRALVASYVELIRNTPFLVQLFFVFFGLPGLGVQIGEMQAAVLAMTVNLGAYATEIVRAGIDSIPAASARRQWRSACRSGRCSAMSCCPRRSPTSFRRCWARC